MPKSSIDSCTPIARRLRRMARAARVARPSALLSVTSTGAGRRRTPASAATCDGAGRSRSDSWRADRLTGDRRRQAERRASGAPARATDVEHERRSAGSIRPELSASVDEGGRRQQPRRRVLPADQGLDADDPPGVQRPPGAGSARQLAGLDRRPQLGSSRSRLGRRRHRRGSSTRRRRALLLRLVEGDVGLLSGGLRRRPPDRALMAIADAGVTPEPRAVDLDRRARTRPAAARRRPAAPRTRRRAAAPRTRRHRAGPPVGSSAAPARRSRRADLGAAAGRRLVPEGVVDVLEVVEVDA